MITLTDHTEINWQTAQAVAYENEPIRISPELLQHVTESRAHFQHLIDQGVPCYGVTTGLGKLVSIELSDEERDDLPHNILRARAAAIGTPFPRPVVRAMMFMRLFNFLSGYSGVTAELCRYIADRLNDGFTPWVPSMGHGMAADAIAHTHAFQTLIGEGYVMAENGARITAKEALALRGVAPIKLGQKEGLALLNGISAAPAYALHAHRQVSAVLALATAVAATSIEGGAAPKDSFEPAVKAMSRQTGTQVLIDQLQARLAHSEIEPHSLQSAISFRIIPQLHGALWDGLATWQTDIDDAIQTFSDNPLMVHDDSPAGGRFLSVGSFHNQHLVNQADHIAIALAHVGALSSRRLHRLLNSYNTGLNTQLAPRPGLDAGLVVAHKATVGLVARLQQLANPVSFLTAESSAGQEDYMSQAIPTIARLYDMVELTKMILSYELLGGLTALRQRPQTAGEGVAPIRAYFADHLPPLTRDRSPGPDVELILEHIGTPQFAALISHV